jgi:hypothetical protein
MLVSDVLTTLKSDANYVANSMVLKSSDNLGCTYKYLGMVNATYAKRREWFISTSTTEDDVTTRTVIGSVEVVPAD